jgi:DNA polymerase-3 subunit epsilon
MQSDLFPSGSDQALSPSFPAKLALIDCETTGGKPAQHRVVEIGLLLIDDGVITERWQTFLDPERVLPPFITKLTGITPPMLKDQPRFAEIAESLQAKLKDRIFVAHNARFDYGFVKTEFERAGITFNAKTLCSVKFSRALYPQFKRHGIDQIIKRFEFSIENRHRALDDAEIIWKLFVKSTQLYSDEELSSALTPILKTPSLPPKIKASQVKALPQAAGVYYFYDEKGTLLYVGKSINIRARVMSHFNSDYRSSKEMIMNNKVAYFDFQRTPGDLGAQLLESHEIKRLAPLYNRRLRRTRKLFSYAITSGPNGYEQVTIKQTNSDQTPDESIGLFRSPRHASKRLEKLADDYFLCFKLLGIEGHPQDQTPCFRRQLKRCFGACEGAEPPHDYNARLAVAMRQQQLIAWPFDTPVVIEERDPADLTFKCFHLVDQWRYLGRIEDDEALREHGFIFKTAAQTLGLDGDQTAQHPQLNAAEASALQTHTDPSAHANFDLDVYHILLRFLLKPDQMKINQLRVHSLQRIPRHCHEEAFIDPLG